MRKTTTTTLAAALLAGGAFAATGGSAQADILFWSTQAAPVEETQAMRGQVLSGFEEAVDYQATDDRGPWLTRIEAELQAGSGTIGLLGALHGEFVSLSDDLVDLSDIELGDVTVNATFQQLGMLGTGEQKYLPWMQATYIMAANRQALDYLPEGADINALTYDELIEWARVLAEETGGPKFGFPAGPQGLKHRFFQGYLYPSYTDSAVTEFRSPEAEEAWNKFKELWQYTSPSSTSYGFMQEPLLTEEVWVAWDHTARLADAFNQRPDDFVAFPAPAGPTGRGFMPVIAGVAIPRTAPDTEAAKALAAYMLKPETQVATLRATNFFPVVEVDLPDDMPASVRLSGQAIARMANADDANPSLLPVGLGEYNGKFNQVFVDAFERIVLAGQDVRQVLDEQGETLRSVMQDSGAPCWAPDEPSEGACPVE
ncbi:extracellular solute-binding protein [Chelativorans salis]|uniref:Extracellular solute-binding protein n=1 Tax=Chelativorans salis TaxID=2978478 RepID=A0ABT2LGA1_9HYPH|nr:extracellular solute-binding protein [Chelativorans sp. EGI FJ00035]MCT7373505.1 extracellular solute-binding protein [Chelativorans sp. EGI FJ00035]